MIETETHLFIYVFLCATTTARVRSCDDRMVSKI